MSEYLANLSGGEVDEKGFLRHLGLFLADAGIVEPGALQVTAQDTPDMSVVVSGGATGHDIFFITDAGDVYHGWNTADYTLTIDANATGSTKQDTIVAYADLSAGSASANNPGGLKFASVRSASIWPTAAATAEIEAAIGAGNPWDYLAYVTVASGASSVNSGNITNGRSLAYIDGSYLNTESVTALKLASESVTNAKLSTAAGEPGGAWTDWTPTVTGFSVEPTGVTYRYKKIGRTVHLAIRQLANGTSNATSFTISLPYTATTITDMLWCGSALVSNGGVTLTTPGLLAISSGATVLDVYKDFAAGTWTASGGKRLGIGHITYEAAS